jgi:hypothetical protein
MQRSYATIKKSGKLYLFLLLSIIPGFCFSSITLHVIKIGARDSTRCKIRSFENTSWSFEEIQKITQFVYAQLFPKSQFRNNIRLKMFNIFEFRLPTSCFQIVIRALIERLFSAVSIKNVLFIITTIIKSLT